MERRVEKKERVVVEEKITWVATDGTEFSTQEECSKYEQTAECVLKSAYEKCVIAKATEYDLWDTGSEEYKVHFIVPQNERDVEMLNRYQLFLDKSRKDKELQFTSDMIGQTVIIWWSYDMDYFYVEGTIDGYIKKRKEHWLKIVEEKWGMENA